VKVLKTDLREQILNFLKKLTVADANAPRTVVLIALPSSQPRETLQHSQLLQTLDHFVGRKDALHEPVEQDEVFKVIERRLPEAMPEDAVASAAAIAYQPILTQMRKAYAGTAAEEQNAAEEGILLRDRMRLAYPFHPSLLDLMRQRWASLPEY
jgi:predicted AAA+ superfamily ATPase